VRFVPQNGQNLQRRHQLQASLPQSQWTKAQQLTQYFAPSPAVAFSPHPEQTNRELRRSSGESLRSQSLPISPVAILLQPYLLISVYTILCTRIAFSVHMDLSFTGAFLDETKILATGFFELVEHFINIPQ